MKKFLCLFVLTLLALSACAPVPAPAPGVTEPQINPSAVVTPAPPAPSLTPAPAPAPLLTPSADIPAYKTYVSLGTGEKVSELLSADDLSHFFALNCGKLLAAMGGDYEDVLSDSGQVYHGYAYPYFDMTLWYEGDAEKNGGQSLYAIQIDRFSFRGITEDDDFAAVMDKLGKAYISAADEINGTFKALQYTYGKLHFDFFADDLEGSGGLRLMVYPVKKYSRYSPVDMKKIDRWFGLGKKRLIKELGGGYLAREGGSGIEGVYNEYDYSGKGIRLYFEQDRLARIILDGRYRVGGSKKAETFADIQKALGKGTVEQEDETYTLTYTNKNCTVVFTSFEEDGSGYKMDIKSIQEG